MMDFATILQILDSTIRLSTPLLLACLAGLFSERAGIFDIGLEGKMLAAAMMSGAIAAVTGSAWIGLAAGIGASMALALVHGVASITYRGNQLISGVAINSLAAGLTVVIALYWFNQGSRTPPLSGDSRFQSLTLPFAETFRDLFGLGPIYFEVISGHAVLVYIAMLAVPAAWWVLNRTRFGLRLRAVGENPSAVDTAGVSVTGLRFAAVLICGLLCGVAGAYLATALSAGFGRDMTAGRGFIALAALIFAKWRPWQALWACLLFGFLEAVGNRYQNIEIPSTLAISILVFLGGALIFSGRKDRLDLVVLGGLGSILLVLALLIFRNAGLGGSTGLPIQLMQALPYILTVVILAGIGGKAVPPRAGGQPYVKER